MADGNNTRRMSDSVRKETDIADIQPDMMIKYRVRNDGSEAEVLLPGLWFTDFDQTNKGRLTIFAVMKLFQSTGLLVLKNGFANYNQWIDDDHAVFMASNTYRFSRNIHAINVKYFWGKSYPLYFKLSLAHVGKSSFTFSQSISDYRDGIKLVDGYFTLVYVEYETRKPLPLPSYMDDFRKATRLNHPPLRLPTPDIPRGAFTYTVQAFVSDIDSYDHISQPVYSKWCADVGAVAASNGHYAGFTEDIGNYPRKQIVLNSIGEGRLSDKFVVHTWQDELDKTVLHFVVTGSGKIIFVAQFSYFSNSKL